MKQVLWVFAALVLALGTACGASSSIDGGGEGGAGGQLIVFGNDPVTLDPALTSDTSSSEYVVEVFSGLVSLDQKLSIVPELAESWEISSDGKTYLFKLRKGAKFHSGREVKAQDFKYSIERAADPKTNSPTADTYLGDIKGLKDKLAGRAREVEGVKVGEDDYTLRIELEASRFYFLAKMSYPTGYVVDKENVESGKNWTDRPNGTGPFKLKEWKKGERIVLERNANYYQAPAKLDQVNVLLAGGSAMTMYENDEVDITGIGFADIERIRDPSDRLNKEFVVAPSLDVQYIGFNVEVPPFDDPKVRQAFNHAVDKERILDVVYRGLYQRADGVIPPGMPGYNPTVRGLKFDPDKARQLLAESKYKGDLPPITYTVPSSATQVSALDEAIMDAWKTNLRLEQTPTCGAAVTKNCFKVQQVEWATFLGDIKRNPAQGKKNKFQLYRLGWAADYPDPQDFVDLLFHSRSLENNGAYSNPEVDKLLNQASSEGNEERRFKLYQEAEQLIVNDAGWVPLAHARLYVLVKPKVKGYTPPPMSIPTFKNVSVK